MTVRRAHPLQPGEQWVPGSRSRGGPVAVRVAMGQGGTARDRGVLETVRRGTKRRALPHARCPERGQARRPRASEVERHVIALGARVRRLSSVLSAIAAEALMNNPGQASLTGLP